MRFILRWQTLVLLTLPFFVGCETVKPWQKGTLARYEMTFSPDTLEQKLNDHTYFAKEASSSGSAVSGGGCGCN